MATSVSAVYLHVIEDVASKVREEFLNSGVDENVLSELQALWELKMMQCGAIQGPVERSSPPRSGVPITPVHDLNVPYEATEEYETPTAEMLFPPTPLQTPIQTPLPGNVEPAMYQYLNTGPNEFANMHDTRGGGDVKNARPSPYMQQPSPWMNQRPLSVDVNVAYVEGRDEEEGGTSHPPMTKDFFTMSAGKRKREDYASHFLPGGYMPQQDGSGDNTLDDFQPEVGNSSNRNYRGTTNSEIQLMQPGRTLQVIPQQDGIHDGYEPGIVNEDYNASADHDILSPHGVATPKPSKTEADDDDEPPLNEDDDDDLDDLEQGDEEPSTHHLVLAQFEKVTRTKSRWKCTLKDGILHLNNKDILFTKAPKPAAKFGELIAPHQGQGGPVQFTRRLAFNHSNQIMMPLIRTGTKNSCQNWGADTPHQGVADSSSLFPCFKSCSSMS